MKTATEITQEHYARQEVRDIIIKNTSFPDGSFRAINADFILWYRYLEDNRIRLMNSQDDYEHVTQTHRVLYSTLNVFRKDLKGKSPLKDDVSSQTPLGTPAETLGYTLGVDIDKNELFKIEEAQEALDHAASFLVEKLKLSGIHKSVWVLFSGGGIYVKLHHAICKPGEDCQGRDRAEFYETVCDRFNRFIGATEEEFKERFPEDGQRVKFDSLNNAKRVFKSILSIHKRLPYAVTPLDRENIKIDLAAAKIPLSSEMLAKADQWYSSYDADEKTNLFQLLDKYPEPEEKKRRANFREVYRSPGKEGMETFPPCMLYILQNENRGAGKTRFSGLLSAFLYQSGWEEEEAWEVIKKISKRNGVGNAGHVFESCFGKLSCPSCKTIQTDGSGYPHLGLKGLGACKPDKNCYKWPGMYGKRQRPMITLTSDLIELIEKVEKTIYDFNDPPTIFQRGGALCRIKTVDSDQYKIEDYSDHAIRNEMSRAAKYEKWSKLEDKFIQCHPPLDIAKGVLALGTWEVPLIRGMIGAPVVREDGSILCVAGYDEATRLYFAQADMLQIPEIPEYPTREDAREAAKNVMEEVLHDFPFLDQASKANALAAFVTPIVRPMISGQTPIALIDKPAPGTGASKILDLISIISTGKEMAALSPADNEAEWRKLITGLLSDGTHIICFDNLDADLKAGTLSRALTSSIWKDRTLGKTDAVEYPQRACWYATGNNISLSGDLPRRAYMIQLDAKLERPWERKVDKFRHPKLNQWVAEHRGELLASLLIMARAWAIAGKPDGCKHVIGGFEDWVSVVGGILKYAGVEGFLDNLVKLYEDSDSGNDEWADFFRVWYSVHMEAPVTSSELIMQLENAGSRLSDAVPGELAEKIKFKGPGNGKKVGIFLRKKLNVRYKGGFTLSQGTDKSTNSKTWIVKIMKDESIC
jgi:hypothetical protein